MTPSLLSVDVDQDPSIEALRSLRASLDLALHDAKNQIVALTGPAPEIGKSFIAANLAYLMATTGRRVLLVDGDLRRGHLHRYLGQPYAPGLADLLNHGSDSEPCVRRSLFDQSLDFIASGKYPSNPSELFIKGNVCGLLNQLAAGYDVTVVDLPPVLSVVDPLIAMRATGVNLMVLRAGKHVEQEIAYALARLHQNDIPMTAFVLNDLTRGKTSYGYQTYAYSYDAE